MKKNVFAMIGLVSAYILWTTDAMSFDVTTVAHVQYIDEWDVAYTRVQIDQPTSCGSSLFWMNRNNEEYNLYMARVLAALVAGREIRITERSPAYCSGGHLYNPRVGNM